MRVNQWTSGDAMEVRLDGITVGRVLTRGQFFAEVIVAISNALGDMGEQMTMADFGTLTSAVSDVGRRHKHELPRPE